VVSAFPAPEDTARTAAHPAEPFQVRSRTQLLGELRDRGGCPPEVFDDPDLLEMTVTLMGHDLHLADTYRLPAGTSDAEYHVWYGRDDKHLTPDELQRWNGTRREFRGGHFYLLQTEQAAVALHDLVSGSLAELAQRQQ
jgi:surfactin synthase thioesterase subunit